MRESFWLKWYGDPNWPNIISLMSQRNLSESQFAIITKLDLLYYFYCTPIAFLYKNKQVIVSQFGISNETKLDRTIQPKVLFSQVRPEKVERRFRDTSLPSL